MIDLLRWRAALRLSLLFWASLGCGNLGAQVAAPAAGEAVSHVIQLIRSGQFAAAADLAREQLKLHPREPRLWTALGVAYTQANQPKAAHEAFGQALKLDPANVPALEGAAQVAYTAALPSAEEDVRALLARVPSDPAGNAMLGAIAARAGDCKRAIAAFQQASALLQKNAEALDIFGGCLLHEGRQAEAADVYRTEVQLAGAPPRARLRLALALYLQQKYTEAADSLAPLLSSQDQPVLLLQARILEARGETKAAVETLRQAIALDPHTLANYLEIASICFDTKSYRDGVTMLDFAIRQNPAAASLHTARGVLRMQLAEEDAAAEDFAAAERLDESQPFQKEAHVLMAMQKNDLVLAEKHVAQELRKAPHDSFLNYLAAQIIHEQGTEGRPERLTSAIGYAEAAVKLDGTNLVARDLLASLYFERHDYKAAADESRTALRANPSDEAALYRLLLSLRRGGDPNHEVPGLSQRLGELRLKDHELQEAAQQSRP